MPFAEFQPGNAGLALSDFSLRSQDAYASLMDRAQRRKFAEQEMDMKREDHAARLATSSLQQDALRAEIGLNQIKLGEAERTTREINSLRDQYAAAAPKIAETLDFISKQRDPVQQRRLLNQLNSQSAIFYRDPALKGVLETQFKVAHDTIAANESSDLAQAISDNRTAPDELTARQKFPGQQLRVTVDPSLGIPVYVATGKPDAQMEARAVALLSLVDDEDGLTKAVSDPTVNMMLGIPGSRVAELYRTQRAKLVTERQKDDETGVKKTAANAKAAEDSRERSVPGFDGMAPTKEEAIKFRDLTSNNDQILSGVREIASLSSQKGASVDPDIRARIGTVQAFLVGKLRLPMTGPGAFTDSEREFVKDTIGNPTKIFSLSSSERTKLDELVKRLTNDIDTTAAGLGLKRTSKSSSGPVSGSRAQAIARGGSGKP